MERALHSIEGELMANAIWKYELTSHVTTVKIPGLVRFLDVQMKDGAPCVWAEVDPEATSVEEWILCAIGTGSPLPNSPGEYIGTVIADDGFHVWHIFGKRGAS